MRWTQHTNLKGIPFYGTLLLLLQSVKSVDNSDQTNADSIRNFNSLNASCKLNISSSTATKICLTPECIDAASYLLSSMDRSVDPCEDFYQFSCGGWIEKHRIPEGQSEVSVLSELEKKIANDMTLLLEEDRNVSEADHVRKIKETYKSCMDFRGIKDAGHEPLVRFHKPIIDATFIIMNNIKRWRVDKYNWMDTLRIIRKAGFSHTFPLIIGVFGNHIEIDNPVIKFKELLDGSFFNESFDIQNSPQALSNREQLRKIGFDLRLDMNTSDAVQEISKMNIMDGIFSLFTWSSLLPPGMQMEIKPCLLDALTPLDKTKFQYPAETYKKIMFCLEKLKNKTGIESKNKNRRDHEYYRYEYTVKELQEIAPGIDWLKYFNTLFDDPISENETLLIPEITPIRYVAKFMNRTHKRSILVYYLWHVAKEYDDLLKELTQKEENRGKRCLGYIAKYLDLALSSLYAKRYFKEEKKSTVTIMVNYIKHVFEKILESRTWIKADHKEKMKKKVWSIKVNTGYTKLLDDEVISNLYEDLKISTNYIENHMRMKKLETDRKFSRIFKRNTRWEQFTRIMDSEITNDLCNAGRNIPAGRLQSPYLDTNRPQYLNYGALGSVIGRGIAYKFNQKHSGSHKDENLEPWWGTDIEQKYNFSKRCIIEQYRNYLEQMGIKPTSYNTIDRDLADNLGLKLAYLAYNSWVNNHGTEAHLPGLEKYTPKQLFWISSASGMCGKYKLDSLDREKQTNLLFLRVLGSVSNRPEFANDFKCKVGSKMNPEKKCQFW